MPRFQVTPEQLVAAGVRLRTAGTRLQEAAGGFSQTAGDLPAACGDPEAGAACHTMGAIWTEAMLLVAATTLELGILVEAGAESYRVTDETAVPDAPRTTAGRVGEGVAG